MIDWLVIVQVFQIQNIIRLEDFQIQNIIVLKFFEIQNIRLEDCHALWGRTSAILHEFQGFQVLKDFKDARIPLEKGQLDSCKSRKY